MGWADWGPSHGSRKTARDKTTKEEESIKELYYYNGP